MASLQTALRKMVSTTLAASLLALALPARANAAPGAFDLSSPANGAWCTATCTFTWQTASSAASYDLYIDGSLKKAALPVVVPPGYALAAGESITGGWHTWYIVARDSGGTTTQSTSTWSVQVDANPPTAPALVSPAASVWTSSAAPTFTWTASTDVGSGLSGYEVWLNGTAANTRIAATATSAAVNLPTTAVSQNSFNANCPGWTAAGNGWWCGIENTGAFPYVEVFDLNYFVGAHSGSITMSSVIDLTNAGSTYLALNHKVYNPTATLEIRASDDNGATWRLVKRIPPTTPSSLSDQSFPLDDFTGTATTTLQFYGSNNQAWEGWEIYSFNVFAVLGGIYTWQVVAVDLAGNRTASENRQVRYALPPAPFDLTTPLNGAWTANTTPTFAWNATTDADSGLANYELWIDGNLAVDNISATANAAAATSALAEGTHFWQAYAVDAAGAVRHSRETFSIGIDTTPPAGFSLLSPADQITSTIPTPTLCWNATSDAGSGLDHYQLFIDGSLNHDGITGTCSTPTATLAQGAHTWSVDAIDGVGNTRAATQTWTIYIDFAPPAGFVLLTLGNGTAVDIPTPTFTWGASSDTGSGLSRYELRVDGVCVACSIASTSTTYTLTAPLTAGTHTWSVTAVDGVAGSTVATGAPWTFTAQGSAPDLGPEPGPEPVLEPGPEAGSEPGPEPAPEPARDAGVDAVIDAPADSVVDGPTPSTSTATGTLTRAGTGTATSTSTVSATATSTSVIAEPRPDGAVMVGADAPILVADAGIPDTAGARDGLPIDSLLTAADAWTATPVADASTGLNLPDGGLGLADTLVANTLDAKVATSDGGRADVAAGSGYDANGGGKGSSSGCGCTVGGHDADAVWGLLLVFLGLLVFRRGSRPRRRGPCTGQR